MLTDEELDIIDKLKKHLGYNAPRITQEQFDNIVEYVIQNEKKSHEILWRLCGSYEGYNFNKVVDIFVDSKDSYYISELVSYVNGKLDQEYLTKKMLGTKDVDFIKSTLSYCGDAMEFYLDKKCIKVLKDFISTTK